MIARTYAVESLIYRTAGLIDAALADTAHDGAAVAQAFEEYAVEASIAKVGGSETLDFVLDENVQIHGGNGFVKDYPAERYYRDARVNRIFEGTNEINRMLIPGMLIRRALKGELPLIAAAKRLQDEMLSPSVPAPGFADDGGLDEELRAVGGVQEGRADGARHRDADLRPEAQRRAGGPELRRRHHDRHLCGRERRAARAAPRPRGACRVPTCTRRRRGCSSTMPRSASSRPRAARWRRWPKATRCARCWPRCAACSR